MQTVIRLKVLSRTDHGGGHHSLELGTLNDGTGILRPKNDHYGSLVLTGLEKNEAIAFNPGDLLLVTIGRLMPDPVIRGHEHLAQQNTNPINEGIPNSAPSQETAEGLADVGHGPGPEPPANVGWSKEGMGW